jgi:NAD(P)-dependent dehydrogenase (short-subunit alcohol dehydrogenase family)
MKIENAVALVTGANRGIGKALVDALLAAGAKKVYAAARDPKQVAANDRVVPVKLDVTDPRDVAALAERAPDVTLLINNAGVFGSTALLAGAKADFERDLATNVFGTLAVTQALAPTIERAGGGAVANVLSVVSLASMPGFAGYSATKAAAFSVTQGLRAELRAKGIAVHAVFPGPVDTDMTKAIPIAKATPESVAKAIVDGIARGDEDIAPDAMARDVLAAWQRDPKGLERQFASMGAGA